MTLDALLRIPSETDFVSGGAPSDGDAPTRVKTGHNVTADDAESLRLWFHKRDADPSYYAPLAPFVDPELTDEERAELDRVFGAEHRHDEDDLDPFAPVVDDEDILDESETDGIDGDAT